MFYKLHYFLFALLFISSCKKSSQETNGKTTSPLNTVSIMIEDRLWNGQLGDSIRNKFASPVIGLPQEEPLFTINQYPAKFMDGFMKDSRNIIVFKIGKERCFELIKNQYAEPQNVFHITGGSTSELIALVEKHSLEIISQIKQSEIEESQKLNRKSLLNSKKINAAFQLSIEVPSTYSYALEKENFIWLKKEIVSGNLSLLLYQIPLKLVDQEQDLTTTIIKVRDSIGCLYIHGTEPDTFLITEESYTPYFFRTKLDQKPAFETKGNWELKNDFMSGPFINYAVIDQEHSRLLVLEGFCYAPSKEKRDLIFELESIIKSIKIDK